MRTSARQDWDPRPHPAVEADAGARDEAALWSRWRDASDAIARELLVERYRQFAKTIAAVVYSRRSGGGVEFEDYQQFALVGLLEALDRYDPDRGAQFKTFAGPRIRGAILSGLERMTERQDLVAKRRQLERERITSAVPVLGALEGEALLVRLGDIGVNVAIEYVLDGIGLGEEAREELPDPYRQVELQQVREQVSAMTARLAPRERVVVQLHYAEGRTFEEIAETLEVSRPRVSQIHRRAIERLRSMLSKAEICDAKL